MTHQLRVKVNNHGREIVAVRVFSCVRTCLMLWDDFFNFSVSWFKTKQVWWNNSLSWKASLCFSSTKFFMHFTFCMVTSQVVIKVGESSDVSCNILLIGCKRFKMSSFMELKSNDFVLAIFLWIPSRTGASFFMVWLCSCFFAGHKNQLRLTNYEDEVPMQRSDVQPILFQLIFCSTCV